MAVQPKVVNTITIYGRIDKITSKMDKISVLRALVPVFKIECTQFPFRRIVEDAAMKDLIRKNFTFTRLVVPLQQYTTVYFHNIRYLRSRNFVDF